jgi:hypothetical protein
MTKKEVQGLCMCDEIEMNITTRWKWWRLFDVGCVAGGLI